MFIWQPVRDASGQINGLLQIGLPLDTLHTALRLNRCPPGARCPVMHVNGTVLSASAGQEDWVGRQLNSDQSTYHSLQTQVTMRPSRGITFQATWTWSRATGVQGSTPDGGGITANYRDFLNRAADYTVAAFHRTHDFRGYATFELPFGPGKFIGGNSTGWFARAIEGWHLGTIFNASTSTRSASPHEI